MVWPGGKRELVGRQQLRPAVRLERAGAFPPKGALQLEKQGDARRDRQSGCQERVKSLRPAVERHGQAQRVPQPAIAAARRGQHPHPQPFGGPPVVHPDHQPVIARTTSPKYHRGVVI